MPPARGGAAAAAAPAAQKESTKQLTWENETENKVTIEQWEKTIIPKLKKITSHLRNMTNLKVKDWKDMDTDEFDKFMRTLIHKQPDLTEKDPWLTQKDTTGATNIVIKSEQFSGKPPINWDSPPQSAEQTFLTAEGRDTPPPEMTPSPPRGPKPPPPPHRTPPSLRTRAAEGEVLIEPSSPGAAAVAPSAPAKAKMTGYKRYNSAKSIKQKDYIDALDNIKAQWAKLVEIGRLDKSFEKGTIGEFIFLRTIFPDATTDPTGLHPGDVPNARFVQWITENGADIARKFREAGEEAWGNLLIAPEKELIQKLANVISTFQYRTEDRGKPHKNKSVKEILDILGIEKVMKYLDMEEGEYMKAMEELSGDMPPPQRDVNEVEQELHAQLDRLRVEEEQAKDTVEMLLKADPVDPTAVAEAEEQLAKVMSTTFKVEADILALAPPPPKEPDKPDPPPPEPPAPTPLGLMASLGGPRSALGVFRQAQKGAHLAPILSEPPYLDSMNLVAFNYSGYGSFMREHFSKYRANLERHAKYDIFEGARNIDKRVQLAYNRMEVEWSGNQAQQVIARALPHV